MHINQVAVERGQSWVGSGWSLFLKDPWLWLTMSAIYLVVALLLQKIPFIGYLILVLVSSVAAAGAITSAHKLAEAGGEPGRGARLLQRAVGNLVSALGDAERNLPVMVAATLTLGAMVVIQILAQVLKVGGAAVPAMLSGSVGPTIWVPALVSLVIVWTLKLALIMIALLAVGLIMLRREAPLSAMETGIRAAAKNVVPLGVVTCAFLVPLALGAYFKPPANYFLLFAIGLATLPLFITTSYAAFKELFAT